MHLLHSNTNDSIATQAGCPIQVLMTFIIIGQYYPESRGQSSREKSLGPESAHPRRGTPFLLLRGHV